MSPAKTLGATKKKKAEPRMATVIVRLRRSRGVGSLYDPSILRLDVRLLDDGAELLGVGAVLKASRLRLRAEGAR
jgi:hypothetical protein